MMSYEEYKDYYFDHKGTLYGESFSSRKNSLNEKQLLQKYKNYTRREENSQKKFKNNLEKEYNKPNKDRIDYKWEELKSKLDFKKCTLVAFLEEMKDTDSLLKLRANGSFLLKTIDPAHVFPKGGYPELKYDIENVIPLNRFSHSMLDQGRDPITGDRIPKKITDLYWRALIGDKIYEKLQNRIRENRNGKIR
jgi:hypothetical protein